MCRLWPAGGRRLRFRRRIRLTLTPREVQTVALSESTQAAIDQAFSDQQKAKEADAARQEANSTAVEARLAAEKTEGVAILAHKKAIDSANAAISALMTDLGVPPPEAGRTATGRKK